MNILPKITSLNNVMEVSFPHGLVGFPSAQQFTLQLVDEKQIPLVRLYCSKPYALQFYAVVYLPQASVWKAQDLLCAAAKYNIAEENLIILLLIASEKQDSGHKIVTGNAQAPILLDRKKMEAWQHIFEEGSYDMRYQIFKQ